MVDDEPYIVLPPDNTINTKDEAFKLDEGMDAEKVASPQPSTKATTLPTQPPITTPSTTTTPMITTPILTTPPTTLPTTPTPPQTTKPTQKAQVIDIQAATPFLKRTIPTRAANINLNLEIGNGEDTSQPQQHQSVPVTPTAQSIFPSNQQAESAEQPTPQIIIAPMPAGSDGSQSQQPQIIMAQSAQTPPPSQYVFAPQPTSQPQPQYVIAAPQPAQPQPQYVIAAPQPTQTPPAPIILAAPTPPPRPAIYQQPIIQSVPGPAPVSASPVYLSQVAPPRAIIAAPASQAVSAFGAVASQPQVTVSASPPASITVNSPASVSPMGDLNNMMMSSSLMGMSSMNPFLTGITGIGGLQLPAFQNPQFPMNSQWPSLSTPLAQQLQLYSPMLSSPLLSSAPQGFDPFLYNGLTTMFANAIRSAMVQPQPNALASALAIAANQAESRNQPPDLLTAALTQALAQNIQQGIQPISNNKLVQALSQALSQVQPAATPSSNIAAYPPQQQPPPRQQPPLQQQQQQHQQQQQQQQQLLQPPPRDTQQPPPPYPPIQIPPYQVVPGQTPPIRDLRSDKTNNNYSVNRVGKALASALIKAARRIAGRNPRLSTQRRKGLRYRHRSRYDGHYRARSFVPLLKQNSPDFNYQKLNLPIINWEDKDMKNYFAMFRLFWTRISSPCRLRGCRIFRGCLG